MSDAIGMSGDAVTARSPRLLIVEDEARIASFLIKGFSAQGYGVEHVTTGAAALEARRDPTIDLIILDLGLPDMDGLEVLRRLRESGDAIPVLILTARAEPVDVIEGLDLATYDYMTKPFVFGELSARVRARVSDRD